MGGIGLTHVKLKSCLSNSVQYILWKYCVFDSTSDYKKINNQRALKSLLSSGMKSN